MPSVPELESTGAVFGAREVGGLLDMDDVVGIAEIMDFVGVYQDSPRMHSIIDEGEKRGMYLQGHAPYVSGKELAAYRVEGPKSDHESATAAEIREKLRAGIHVNLRASSLADHLSALARRGWEAAISWIYTFTVIVVITFAIEIGQHITGTGSMEFADIVFGIVGFLLMYLVYALILLLLKLLRKLLGK